MADAPEILKDEKLRDSYPKLNAAIRNSNEALSTANTAKSTADTAKNTADTALSNSENTQTQLDTIVINGDSSVEAAQARVNLYGNASDTLKARLDASEKQLEDLGYNIRWNALLALNGDWTNAIQTALDNYTHVYIPKGTFPFSSLTVSKFGATISGDGQLLGGSTLEYRGIGVAIKVLDTVGYISVKNISIKGVPAVATDYFNTGAVGIDITAGNTSIVAERLYIQGFERLIEANYNSFYNRFVGCRFEKAKICLNKFSNNNMIVKNNRFVRFHQAIIANGNNGPLTIEENSFEVFNGEIVFGSGTEKGLVVFKNNYVETYDSENLPTNFPHKEANGALVGKFGGNILFTGYFGNLIIKDNELQLGGVFRIASLAGIDYVESSGNNIHLYSSGNNLLNMYSLPGIKTYYIKDRLGKDIGVGPYSRSYTQGALTADNAYNEAYFYDCVLGKELIDVSKVYNPTLTNGWINTTTAGYGSVKVFPKQEGLYLQGTIDGTNSTTIEILTLPTTIRPLAQGTTKSFCNLITYTNFGSGEKVRLRYLYGSGVLRLEGAPTSKADINLDGLFIPMQT